MATIQNEKDKLLQAASVRIDATLLPNTIQTYIQDDPPASPNEGDLWMDSDDEYKIYRWNGTAWDYAPQLQAQWSKVFGTGLPEDYATFGATVDVNLQGLINTHNIVTNAVSIYEFAETNTYLPSTETMAVNLTTNPDSGQVIIFVSLFFRSNYNSTNGYSEATVTISMNGVEFFNGVVCRVPNSTIGLPWEFVLSEKTMNNPVDPNAFTYDALITHDGDLLVTHAGDVLTANSPSEFDADYDVTATFDATGDGTRGEIIHLAVYTLVLKR